MADRSRLQEIEGRFVGERYRKGEFFIGSITPCNGSVAAVKKAGASVERLTIKGEASEDELQQRQTYRFYGRWTSYNNEKQFTFDSFVPAVAHDREGIVAYIEAAGRGQGVGYGTACKAYEMWGTDAVRVIRENPRELLAINKRITDDQLTTIGARLQAQAKTEAAQIEVTNLLSGRGFPKTLYRKTIKIWGNRAAIEIRQNPYLLMRFRGVGFKLCDSLYLELGLDPTAMIRQVLCAWYSLASNNDGHIWFPIEYARQAVIRSIGRDAKPDQAIEYALELGRRSPDAYGAMAMIRTNGSGQITPDGTKLWVAEGKKAATEERLAQLIVAALDETRPRQITEWEEREVTETVILDYARCHRCSRQLTAPQVHIWNGRPFGPTCIHAITDGEDVEIVSLQEWLERNPAVFKSIQELPKGVVDLPEFSLWPEIDAIEGIDQHQREQLNKALTGRIGILGGSPGTGKAQPVDEPVLTPSGWKPIGSLKPGDYVMSATTGGPVLVKAVFPQGVKPVFRVEMSDGSWTRSCAEHLWQTRTKKERCQLRASSGKVLSVSKLIKLTCGKVRQLSEIMETLDRGDGSPNHSIPLTMPLQQFGPSEPLPLDSYVLGVLLGDGSIEQSSVVLHTPDADVLFETQKRLPASSRVTMTPSRCGFGIRGTVHHKNEVLEAMRILGLAGKNSHEKFIPKIYLLSSIQSRLDLLQGLLDTDGYTDGHCVEYSTSSKQLAEDVQQIVWSLGGLVTVTEKTPTYTYNGEKRSGRLSYRMVIKLPEDIPPFKMRRKAEKYVPKSKYPPQRYIKSVTPCGEEQCVCISIDTQDGLYLTRSCIVTHNTHTTAQLVKALIKSGRVSPEDIAIAAPTGKATVRLNEVFHAAGVPVRAYTWHSLLGVGEIDEESGGWSFAHNASNPWPFKIIIGDEESMKDTSLMCAVFLARPRGCHVLLVGDINQLPPVGCGAPLRDLIDAGLPYGQLTEIKRNSGGIVEACAAIRDSKPWSEGDNLKIIAASTPQDQLQAMVDRLFELGSDWDPVWDAQVIVAVNKKSPLSRKVVNELLQFELNPNEVIEGSPFRLADKVVCTTNSWYPPVPGFDTNHLDPAMLREKQDGELQIYVANGELGRVLTVEDKKLTVALSNPLREIIVPRGAMSEAVSSGDDEDDKSSTGCNFELGYGISCHRMQGSEVPNVLVLVDEYSGARNICSREWWTTALSRAKSYCGAIGKKGTIDAMCRRVALTKRKTFLREQILLRQAEKLLESIR